MSEVVEVIELEIRPIPPDTVSSVRGELVPLIERTLRDAGRESLLVDGEIRIDIGRPLSVDTVIVIGLTFLSQVALETYKKLLLPVLKERVEVRRKARRKKKARRTS